MLKSLTAGALVYVCMCVYVCVSYYFLVLIVCVCVCVIFVLWDLIGTIASSKMQKQKLRAADP